MPPATDISTASEAAAAVAALPRTSTDERCRVIIDVLAAVRGRPLALRTMWEVAEILRPPADEVITAYRTTYTDRALPLAEDEAGRFTQAIALLAEFGAVYERISEAAAASSARDEMAGALQRGMACSVEQMIEHYRARQSIGMALWQGLQERMHMAVREKLDGIAVPDACNPLAPGTAHATYGRALLLSIAQAGAMVYRSLEATLALTAHYAPLVEVAMLDSKEGGDARARGAGAGVGIQRTGRIRIVTVGGVTHLVNTTKIDGALNTCIQQLSTGVLPAQIGLAAVAQADLASLLPRLRRIWCGAGEIRESERQPVQAQSAVAIGFREIYQFASRGPTKVPKQFEVYSADHLPAVGERSKVLGSNEQINPVESWQTLDRSESGMRAKRPAPGAQLRRGQLLAVDFHGLEQGSGFALAEVRWLQQFTEDDAGGIAAGVRFVSSRAQVALVRAFGLEASQYQTVGPAFVLDAAQPDHLVLPFGWFAPRRRVDLWYREKVQTIELTGVRTRGADYEIVAYRPAPPVEPSKPVGKR